MSKKGKTSAPSGRPAALRQKPPAAAPKEADAAMELSDLLSPELKLKLDKNKQSAGFAESDSFRYSSCCDHQSHAL
jgi:hypothetical protein